MNEIKCPHCGTTFTINETEYNQLLAQIRSEEFERELHDRLAREKDLLVEKSKNQLQELNNQKDQEIVSLRAELDKLSEKNALELTNALAQKNQEVQELRAKLERQSLQHENELQKSLSHIEKERDQLKGQLLVQEKERQLELSSVRHDYEAQLKVANEQVAFYKDFKAQQSTKAIGESLEIYAETEFNKVRSLAFPNATFGKDNTVSGESRSKGDYIYREKDENGVEILSIMFEMKNEADTTKTKHKNKDFYKELDKDRREKDCEYAVLVSMLETDNDYFNTGIVDVSHEYEKMYVVRPQLFIQLIGILRNAALNSLKYKQELALVQQQNYDITHFETQLNDYKDKFGTSVRYAKDRFDDTLKAIDGSIADLMKAKENLLKTVNHLSTAENKLDDITIRKLTRNNPTMKAKFEALKE